MAAEAYARVDNTPAVAIVTNGPGAANAVTGVLCAWMESIPMMVLSGQARFATTVRGIGLPIRTHGIQEFDITRATSSMTKYAVMVEKAEDIRYHAERALYLMSHGRKGPVWLDIPLDVQCAEIEPESLRAYDPAEDPQERIPAIAPETADLILDKIASSRRPVLFGGYGVRAAGAVEEFRHLALLLGVPVLTGMSSIDLVSEDFPLYAGRTGITGQRSGNLTMAGSDLFLSIGSRQSLLQTGYDYKEWAREAFTILNDIDPEELKKPNLHVSMPVIGDAKELIGLLTEALEKRGCREDKPFFAGDWTRRALERRALFPPVTEAEKAPQADGRGNLYAFYDALSDRLSEGALVCGDVGTSRVAGIQALRVPEGGRYIANTATASMGYGLPAAVGVTRAAEGREFNLVTGDGSIMMNLQELQTIATNHLPVRVFMIDNQGYHSIRQTQRAYFKEPMIGIGEESGDLGFPDTKKLAELFSFSYAECPSNETLARDMDEAMTLPLPALIAVRVSPLQATEPKASARRLPDGSFVSVPLEDMAPFLPREVLAEQLEIPMTPGEKAR